MLLQKLLQQTMEGFTPNIVLPEKFTELSPSSVYGWLVWGLVGFITYLKIESTMKSWTIRKKDAYIKELHKQMMEAAENSITEKEISIYKKIIKGQENESNTI